ncbi:hypothetical protein KPL71_026291 [Citrus sinensis]|uniref:Uncharacterized protein n=1 Tax=Citrus sinensis TaxID=2711 RepID=A0ACB8HYM1_CITSI|nr:hypothetical protein KPL71_026291 [Citrus sinensis]
MSSKVDLEKFTGQNDFNMWKIKMEALFITQGLGEAIDPVSKLEGGEASSFKTLEQVAEIDKKARSTIILSLGDSVIREVAKERTVAGLWAKLENLYMTKSLANRLYIKRKMFSLKMIEGASLNEHIDEFNKVCDEPETINEGLSDESKALLLISSLPKSYEHFVDALLYGRQTLSLEEVKSALGTKKLKDKKNKNKETKERTGNAVIATEEECSFETAGVLIATSQKPQGQWVLDSDQTGCVIKAEKDVLRVIKGSMVIMKGLKQNGLYMMDGHTAVREASTGLKLKTLRTYNGLEYCNKLFEEFCEKNGIQRHKTVTYTPQQNGLAERMNKTLVQKVRCMLIYSKLPKTIWVEALNTACYLVNRSPSTAIDCKTPMELWSGRMADYAKLIIFCCTAYAHVKQGKLEPRALKCRFLGYPEGVKGYRLWCVDSKPPQCIISRNVRFHKEELLNKPRSPVNNTESGTETDKVKFQVEPQNLKELEPETVGAETEPEYGVEHESAESEEDTYQLARDRKRRTIRPPKRYAVADLIAYALTVAQELNDDEPMTYQEAIRGKNKLEWKRAMDEEMTSLMKNKTWELIEKPTKRKTVSCKWIFKIKDGIPGAEPRRFKARLVARGFTQKEGIDFTEAFSPVVRHASIRIILALVVVQDMHLEHMDVKTGFLHGEL